MTSATYLDDHCSIINQRSLCTCINVSGNCSHPTQQWIFRAQCSKIEQVPCSKYYAHAAYNIQFLLRLSERYSFISVVICGLSFLALLHCIVLYCTGYFSPSIMQGRIKWCSLIPWLLRGICMGLHCTMIYKSSCMWLSKVIVLLLL